MTSPNAGFAYQEQIGPEGHGRTTLAFLTDHYRHDDESQWRVRIAAGEVLIGNRVASPDDALRRGDRLVWNRPPWIEPEAPLTFGILYEDEDLLAVDKPSGLPTMPGGGFLENTLLAQVRRMAPEATPMHRLGRGTSGIVLFGRTSQAGSLVQAAWRRHEVRKVYRALAEGLPLSDAFTIDTRIGPVTHPLLGDVFAANDAGKVATSHVTVVERRANESLVDVIIDTGRPHQIRIHLASAGHPLVGDPLYVSGGLPRPDTHVLPGDLGYLLHAASLSLVHPRTKTPLKIRCRPPLALLARTERPACEVQPLP